MTVICSYTANTRMVVNWCGNQEGQTSLWSMGPGRLPLGLGSASLQLLLLLRLELLQLLDLLHSQWRGSVLLELHALLATCRVHPCQIFSNMAHAVCLICLVSVLP